MGSTQGIMAKTIELKAHAGEMIKPAEMIDISGAGGISLFAGKVYNQLIYHAFGPMMAASGEDFTIPLSELRGLHKGNDRISGAIEALQKTIVKVRLSNGKTRTVQLLGGCDMDDEDRPHGRLTYGFDKRMVALLQSSYIFAKLELSVIYQFSSKYALALYEAVAKRIRLNSCVEEFSLAEFRELLRVPPGKLENFGKLNERAIRPALLEVNGLADFDVYVRPRKEGKRVVGVLMSWGWKDDEGRREAFAECRRSRVGRRARLEGTVERVGVAKT